MAIIIQFPRTAAGRALLKDVLQGLKDPTYVATLFDWDESAEFDREMEEKFKDEDYRQQVLRGMV